MLNNHSLKNINLKNIYISKEMWKIISFEEKEIIKNKYTNRELKLNFLLCSAYETFKTKKFLIDFIIFQAFIFATDLYIISIIFFLIFLILNFIKKDYYQEKEHYKWFRR